MHKRHKEFTLGKPTGRKPIQIFLEQIIPIQVQNHSWRETLSHNRSPFFTRNTSRGNKYSKDNKNPKNCFFDFCYAWFKLHTRREKMWVLIIVKMKCWSTLFIFFSSWFFQELGRLVFFLWGRLAILIFILVLSSGTTCTYSLLTF